MDSSISLKDQIWFLRVCHHILFSLYPLWVPENCEHHFSRRMFTLEFFSSRSSDRVGISRSIHIHFAVVKLRPHIRWISAPVTPSDHKKRITPRCSSFVHTESGPAISIVSQRKTKVCGDAETFHKRRQRCYLSAYARRNQYRQLIKNYDTCADTYWHTLVYPVKRLDYFLGNWHSHFSVLPHTTLVRDCLCTGLLKSVIYSQPFRRLNLSYLSPTVLNIHWQINHLTPNDPYSGRTAPLTSKCCILYIYSTNIGTEYFKHGIYSPFFSLQNAVCFIILTYLVHILFTFYIQSVLKFQNNIPAPKG